MRIRVVFQRAIHLLPAVIMLFGLSAAHAQTPELMVNPNTGETPEQFAARTQWWREAKFGMFIHWGVYSVPATSVAGYPAEWYYTGYNENLRKHPELLTTGQIYVQVKDYEKFAAQFNPIKFDAHRWVKTAKDAGMKYIVITSKHHDGFCMFDSKLTNYSIAKATPWKKDPMKMLAEECRKQGIKLCFYHSIMDWHHPDYLPRRPWEQDTRPAGDADLNKYIDYMEGQLKELLTNYGPIGVIWFDGGWEHNQNELRSAEVNKLIRSIQPGIIINDRNHEPQDHSTPEQTIPANALPNGRLWETCMTMNDTWGYARNDTNWKSAEDLIRKLCDIASKGGNFLLNVGPTEAGEFPEAINERLARIGQWMKVNGRSIYGTTKSPFRRLAFDGRCTTKGHTLYLQVFNWPADGVALSGLETKVVGARALDGGEPLRVMPAAGTKLADTTAYFITKPKKIDPIATVIEVDLAGPPIVNEAALTIQPDAQGAITLLANDADIHGQTARVESDGTRPNIGFWTDAKDWISWNLDLPQPGRYAVALDYACTNENAGTRFTLGTDTSRLEGTIPPTGSWNTYKTLNLGELDLPKGRSPLAVHITDMPHGAAMNLRAIRLVPMK